MCLRYIDDSSLLQIEALSGYEVVIPVVVHGDCVLRSKYTTVSNSTTIYAKH